MILLNVLPLILTYNGSLTMSNLAFQIQQTHVSVGQNP